MGMHDTIMRDQKHQDVFKGSPTIKVKKIESSKQLISSQRA